jgi:hypothetical protein
MPALTSSACTGSDRDSKMGWVSKLQAALSTLIINGASPNERARAALAGGKTALAVPPFCPAKVPPLHPIISP